MKRLELIAVLLMALAAASAMVWFSSRAVAPSPPVAYSPSVQAAATDGAAEQRRLAAGRTRADGLAAIRDTLADLQRSGGRDDEVRMLSAKIAELEARTTLTDPALQ